MNKKIGVGIIGIQLDRSWAAIAHIPALQQLTDDYRLTALSTTRQESADIAAKMLNVPKAYDNHLDLVNDPTVDLVVITVKVPHHKELVLAAIDAGKDVYCEWPLGNGLEEAQEMQVKAEQAEVKTIVGLQARCSPSINYMKQLVAQGYVGEVLSTSIVASGLNWGAFIDQPNAYTADKANGATMLSIPFGHTIDALCYSLGEFNELNATLLNRRTEFTLLPDNIKQPMDAEDQVLVNGTLQSGAAVSIHYRGGLCKGTNFLWEINGTEGDLRFTADGGHVQLFDLSLLGANATEESLQPLKIPSDLSHTPPSHAMVHNVAEIYARFAADDAAKPYPTFSDAVKRHEMLVAIEQAAQTGQRQILNL